LGCGCPRRRSLSRHNKTAERSDSHNWGSESIHCLSRLKPQPAVRYLPYQPYQPYQTHQTYSPPTDTRYTATGGVPGAFSNTNRLKPRVKSSDPAGTTNVKFDGACASGENVHE
jgi:hypothetical protein